MNQVVDVIIDFYEEIKPTLHKEYNWPIPAFKGFSEVKTYGYEANVELKKFLHKHWQSATSQEKLIITKFIIAEWGGVRGNKIDTLEKYAKYADMTVPETPLYGVASYSKIFSIADIQKYVIYDARVAACINALQFIAGLKNGIAFNYVQGRNNIIGHASKKQGFVYNENFKIKNLIKSGWDSLGPDETYKTYLSLVKSCSDKLGNVPIYDIEMSLFAFGEQKCTQAIELSN